MRAVSLQPIVWQGTRLRLARVAWYLAAALAGLALIASIPGYIRLAGVFTEQEQSAARLIGIPGLFSPSPQFELWLDVPYHLLSFAAAALSLGLAAAIFRQRSNEPLAFVVSVILLVYGVVMAGPLEMLLGQREANQGIAFFAQMLLWGPILFLLFIFPDGRFVPRWTRWFSILLAPWTLVLAYMQLDTWVENNLTVFMLLYTLPSLVGPYAQWLRYRRVSDRVQRQQTKWVIVGVTATILAGTAAPALLIALARGLPPGVAPSAEAALYVFAARMLWPVSLTFVPLSLAVAIFRYRLWDIDFLINRSLVYGVLTIIVVGGYVLAVGLASALFQSGGSFLLSLLATGLIALLFQPLRSRLQRAVNRLMYGERDDPYAVLSRLGQRLEAVLAPEALLPTLLETIAQALKLPYAAIEVPAPAPAGVEIVAAYGTPAAAALRLPLTYQTERVGELVIAPRGPGESFTAAEQRLLADIAHEAGAAVHAARLTADLQHSRERLVAAREEERRRLRRDLHDGLGPQLASQTLTLTAARQLLRQSPAEADALLAEAVKHAQAAVTDIRRVVYELRPPALDDLGLVGALRALAAQYEASGVRFSHHAPEALPPLPAAVEVACYRIAQEAVTNVVKHAGARHCSITLSLDGALHLEVTDDGRGLPPERRAGVGLTSMRERAEELGGQCRVEPGPAGGTRVLVSLPLP